AREAETAPDTPAFLKNEKRHAHHASHQEQKALARLHVGKPWKHLDQKCSNPAIGNYRFVK
ncbi:hypothetical protein, partial [Pollutimonas bauzanensis]|uniref:hypothetical protein n=1 Tax=Pollutimonas bauzanensis TaxID=658167 RepID=UPI00333EEDA6